MESDLALLGAGGEAATGPAAPVPAPGRSPGRLIPGVPALAVALVPLAAVLLACGGDGNGAEPGSNPGQGEPSGATAPAKSEIRQVVEEFSTSSDPAVCDLGTQAFHEKVWGGSGTTAIEACRTQLPRLERSGQVSIRSLEVSGSSASAEVTFGDDEEGEYTLIDTQEGWRLNGYVLTKEGSNTGKPKRSRRAHITHSQRVGSEPFGVTVAGGTVWVSNKGDDTLSRLDARTGRRKGAAVPTGDQPKESTVSDGVLWVPHAASDEVIGYDVTRALRPRRIARLPVGNHPSDAVAGGGRIWIPLEFDDRLVSLDPRRRALIGEPITVGREPGDVEYAAGKVWVTNFQDDTVVRVHPRTRRLLGRPIHVGNGPEDLVYGGGSIWVANIDAGTVTEIDVRRNRVVGRPFRVGGRPGDITYGFGSLWVTDVRRGSVKRIDPERRKRVGRPLKVGGHPIDITVGGGAVWAASLLGGTVSRIQP